MGPATAAATTGTIMARIPIRNPASTARGIPISTALS